MSRKPHRSYWLLATLLLLACKREKETRLVQYEVVCNGCEVTYENQDNDRKDVEVESGFNFQFETDPKDKVYLKAVKTNLVSGTALVRIRVDGDLLWSDATTAYLGSATAEGQVP